MNPYQPPSPENAIPSAARPGFRIISLATLTLIGSAFVGVLLTVSGLQIGFSRSGRFEPAAGVQIIFGIYFLAVVAPATLRHLRKFRQLPMVQSGEAFCVGEATAPHLGKPVRNQPSVLLLTLQELIFLHNTGQGWDEAPVIRYSLKDIAGEIRSARSRCLSFTDASGQPVKLYVFFPRAWRKAILQTAARLPES